LVYYQTRNRLIYEFSAALGGCSVSDDLEGWYFSTANNELIPDRITLIYTDTPPYTASEERSLRQELETLQQTRANDLDQEAVLMALIPVEHIGET
jgi:hypothetical protein